MKFFIRVVTQNCITHQECGGGSPPRWYFAEAVKSAVSGKADLVEMIRMDRTGVETIIDCWARCEAIAPAPTDASIDEQINIKYGFKIHGFSTTSDPTKSANTLKWYKNEDAAIAAATKMAQKPGNSEALVIYKAIKIVSAAPIEVTVKDLD